MGSEESMSYGLHESILIEGGGGQEAYAIDFFLSRGS